MATLKGTRIRVFTPLMLCAVLLLSACEEQITSTALRTARAALEEAKAIKDPWEAFELLEDRKAALFEICSTQVCKNDNDAARELLAKQRIHYLSSAIDQSNPAALAFLYSRGTPSFEDEYTALRKASIHKLLDYADKATGKTEDRPVLMAAGKMVAEGKAVMLDTGRAFNYYARAWAAGEVWAANRAAMLFLSINDMRNAYFWSLRCTTDCERAYEVELDRLQKHLTPEAVKQAQKLAATTSVIEIGTTGI